MQSEGVISPEIIDIINSIEFNDKNDTSPVKQYLTQIVKECVKNFKSNTQIDDLINNQMMNNFEFEIRFASRNKKNLTKTQFDTVVKYLKSFGFKQVNNTFENKMRILVGTTEDSNIRVELNGLVPIQQYCRTENLESILQMNKDTIHFTNKNNFIDSDGKIYNPYYNVEYDMKYSFTNETDLEINDKVVRNIRQNWKQINKLYRIINRLTFEDGTTNNSLFNIDLSIVKQSSSSRKGKTMLNSGVIDAYPVYEIECEMKNEVIYRELFNLCLKFNNDSTVQDIKDELITYSDKIYDILKKYVKIVNMGIQDSKFIISQNDILNTENQYTKLVYGRTEKILLPRHFCGPSSYTLQPENISDLDTDSEQIKPDIEEGEISSNLEIYNAEIANIRAQYCVTDKADGDRKLLFVNNEGRFYLINTNMQIQYTGCHIKTNKALFNTIIDGEHVTHDKNGKFINNFLAFDIYFINGQNVRGLPFTTMGIGGTVEDEQRLKILNTFIRELNTEWDKSNNKKIPIVIKSKKFFISHQDFSIFECCFKILDGVRNNEYEYETDGLIFTPTLLPVGSSSMKSQGSLFKTTWSNSFKWKPPKYNTIDFLVTTQKNKNGIDIIENMYYGGTNGPNGNEIKQYKKLILRCGYDEKKHGIINACFKVYNGETLRKTGNMDDDNNYLPVPFYPTNPYDENAHVCHIELRNDNLGNKVMLTHEGEVFEDEMIVEFSYDLNAPSNEKWKPLRVRYDKTQEYRNGYNNFGNAYHVANSNWQSIHNPISEYSITTGENIPKPINEDVYYSAEKKSDLTKSMRTFHNIIIKQTILKIGSMLSIPTLLDLAVGKAGDLNKWISSDYDTVIGVDVSKDNINNPLDGACVRYLRKHQKTTYNENIPESLFFHADSSLNLKNGDAFYNDTEREYMQILYGNKSVKENTPNRVKKLAGQFNDGFGVTACMFALHYFFRNTETLKSFLTNVAENTVKDGLFIGCCFDGQRVYDLLKNKKRDESYTIQHNGELITRISKKYDKTSFDANSLSLGMAISVYQESIGTESIEYLVNFDYLIKVMSLFGFELLDSKTISSILSKNIKTSIGNFKVFETMMENKNIKMEKYEKELSYLNNFFIFRKKTNVDIGTIGSLDDIGIIDMLMDKRETQINKILSEQLAQQDTFEKPAPEITKPVEPVEQVQKPVRRVPPGFEEAFTPEGVRYLIDRRKKTEIEQLSKQPGTIRPPKTPPGSPVREVKPPKTPPGSPVREVKPPVKTEEDKPKKKLKLKIKKSSNK